jgi:hypothetical protein
MEGNMSETTNFYAPSSANIEQLRVILQTQAGASVTFEEAEEVGIQLVSLYECLAREHKIIEEDQNGCTD